MGLYETAGAGAPQFFENDQPPITLDQIPDEYFAQAPTARLLTVAEIPDEYFAQAPSAEPTEAIIPLAPIEAHPVADDSRRITLAAARRFSRGRREVKPPVSERDKYAKVRGSKDPNWNVLPFAKGMAREIRYDA